MTALRDLHKDDKPREKLLKKGVESLKNDELLAVLLDRAAGIIIAHNHPSGTLEASRADMAITQRLTEVSRLVGIELLDHVILSKQGYFSFSDEGLL